MLVGMCLTYLLCQTKELFCFFPKCIISTCVHLRDSWMIRILFPNSYKRYSEFYILPCFFSLCSICLNYLPFKMFQLVQEKGCCASFLVVLLSFFSFLMVLTCSSSLMYCTPSHMNCVVQSPWLSLYLSCLLFYCESQSQVYACLYWWCDLHSYWEMTAPWLFKRFLSNTCDTSATATAAVVPGEAWTLRDFLKGKGLWDWRNDICVYVCVCVCVYISKDRKGDGG